MNQNLQPLVVRVQRSNHAVCFAEPEGILLLLPCHTINKLGFHSARGNNPSAPQITFLNEVLATIANEGFYLEAQEWRLIGNTRIPSKDVAISEHVVGVSSCALVGLSGGMFGNVTCSHYIKQSQTTKVLGGCSLLISTAIAKYFGTQ